MGVLAVSAFLPPAWTDPTVFPLIAADGSLSEAQIVFSQAVLEAEGAQPGQAGMALVRHLPWSTNGNHTKRFGKMPPEMVATLLGKHRSTQRLELGAEAPSSPLLTSRLSKPAWRAAETSGDSGVADEAARIQRVRDGHAVGLLFGLPEAVVREMIIQKKFPATLPDLEKGRERLLLELGRCGLRHRQYWQPSEDTAETETMKSRLSALINEIGLRILAIEPERISELSYAEALELWSAARRRFQWLAYERGDLGADWTADEILPGQTILQTPFEGSAHGSAVFAYHYLKDTLWGRMRKLDEAKETATR